MEELSPGAPQPTGPPEDRLNSWKEIAAYFDRDVTTVQRWEKREGMPVHRHVHDKMGSVYAWAPELDTWARGRNLRGTQEIANNVPPTTPLPPPALPSVVTKWRIVLALSAVAVALTIVASLWLSRAGYFWQDPTAKARFQILTDFEGTEQAAAVSRDGQFVAFLSDRDGQTDVWVTQVGSGESHNLTRGSAKDLLNPQLRCLGFSPDGSEVTFWERKRSDSSHLDIGVWGVPTLGGPSRPYLEGVAEFDWSHDGSRLVYHTPGPGDPMFVSDGSRRPDDRPVFTAPAGAHCHFQLWSPDDRFIYFVRGSVPDKLDIWRIPPAGGTPERITSHNGRLSHPVLLDRRTLLYLVTDPDGTGPWLYGMDVERRIPHRLTSGLDRYTSMAVSADGHRLVVTRSSPKRSLWRVSTADKSLRSSAAQISLTTRSGFSPRLGPNYLLYVSSTGSSDSIWKLAGGTTSELWNGSAAQILGGPAIARDGQHIAFSVRQHGRTSLYMMLADGTNARIVSDSLEFQGTPAWTSDGQSITSAVNENGTPHLYRVPINGQTPTRFVQEYSLDPAWSPDGRFSVYSGPDIGTTISVKAVTAEAAARPLPPLTLTRGSRRLDFLSGGHELVLLRGEMHHKNLWLVDLETGAERQLTDLAPEVDVSDFDISADGREIVLERMQERSDVVLLDLSNR